MKKFIMERTFPYEHVLRVGVRAGSARQAEVAATTAFKDGTLWDDAPNMPLLYDDYEETHVGPLSFDATEVAEWPAQHFTARASRVAALAHRMEALVRNVAAGNTELSTLESEAREIVKLLPKERAK